jgi:hypothetical protein
MAVAFQMRRGSAIPAGEVHYIGECLWDPANSRFGVYNARTATAMEWYPRIIGDKMLMNQNQTIGGLDSSGAENVLYLDFNTAGNLRVRNRTTGTVIATFAESGSIFNSAVSLTTPYLGMINRSLNGNLSVVKTVGALTVADTNTVAQRTYCVAPNWHLWKQAGTNGRLTASYDIVDKPFPNCPRVLTISSASNPDSSGLRSYVYDTESMVGEEITVSFWIKGVVGRTSTRRIISSGGTVLASDSYTANGGWQRVSSTFTMPNDNSTCIFIDVLYNPASNGLSSSIWKVGALQTEYGVTPSTFENRPSDFESSLCTSIYTEGQIYTPSATGYAAGSCPVALPDNAIVETYNYTDPTKKANISYPTKYGFLANVPGAVGPCLVRYAAYSYPLTSETD